MTTQYTLFLCSILLTGSGCAAEPWVWENMNPGAGGQIQDVNLDPSIPGRAYFNSDMEGSYRTDDYGSSWHYIGRGQSDSDVMAIGIDPQNSSRIYAASKYGVDISDDAGATWRSVRELEQTYFMSFGFIANHPDLIIAGPGARNRPGVHTGRMRERGNICDGPGAVYISRDRGESWEKSIYEKEPHQFEVYQISASPDGSTLYLATVAGLYRSNDHGQSWSRMPEPAGVGRATGVTVSPNGKQLYSAFVKTGAKNNRFARDGSSGIYVSRADNIEWTELNQNGFNSADGKAIYWMIKIDPRSTAEEQRIIAPTLNPRIGLYECTLSFNQNELSGYEWNRVLFWNSDQGDRPAFDPGWEYRTPRSLTAQYTPLTWKRAIWATGDQTLFRSEDENYVKWTPLHTRFEKEYEGRNGQTVRTYRTTGVACTYDYDIDADKNYAIQSMGDNGAMESWDGGKSWAWKYNFSGWPDLSQSHGNIILPTEPKTVLAHLGTGYGAMAFGGTLYAMRLNHYSPQDRWFKIAGGKELKHGLPNDYYRSFACAPTNPNRVFVAVFQHHLGKEKDHRYGVFLIDDIAELIDSAEAGREPKTDGFREITAGSPLENESIHHVFTDPNHEGVIYLCSQKKGNWKGTEQHDGSWNFECIYQETNQMEGNLFVWDHSGTTLLASVDFEAKNVVLEYSTNGGKSWNQAVDSHDMQPYVEPFQWHRPELPGRLRMNGIAGYKNRIYFTYFDAARHKSAGYFAWNIESAEIEDITGNLEFPVIRKVKIREIDGKPWLLTGTRGTGMWKTCIEAHQ